MLSFVLGTTSTSGVDWSERDPIEEREGEGEGEDGKIAEALALDAASARRAGPGPDACRDQLCVPQTIAPRRAAPPPPSWPRPRRVPPPDDDDLTRSC